MINPKDRLALLEMDEMCSDHFNLLLTVIPRYDAESTYSSLDPQKKYVRQGGLCLFRLAILRDVRESTHCSKGVGHEVPCVEGRYPR